MAQMSPLAKFLMLILRNGSIGSVCLIGLFMAIFLYQKISPDGHLVMVKQDWGFLGVLVALMLLAIYLVRSIANEIKRSGE
jgi:hypothetical protein